MGQEEQVSYDLTEEIERKLVYIGKCASWKVKCEDFRVVIYVT